MIPIKNHSKRNNPKAVVLFLPVQSVGYRLKKDGLSYKISGFLEKSKPGCRKAGEVSVTDTVQSPRPANDIVFAVSHCHHLPKHRQLHREVQPSVFWPGQAAL